MKSTKADIRDFLSQPALAIVGVSRSGKKFGNAVYREMKAKGYRVYAIHPEAKTLEGDPCYPDLAHLPEKVGGVVVVVPPAQSEQVVRAAAQAGIHRVWMQQGAESPEAIRFCQENGMRVVAGECVFMFAEPVGFLHGAHRWVKGLIGQLPK
jgi:hypothetical protein